jgi:hypothetical protein
VGGRGGRGYEGWQGNTRQRAMTTTRTDTKAKAMITTKIETKTKARPRVSNPIINSLLRLESLNHISLKSHNASTM